MGNALGRFWASGRPRVRQVEDQSLQVEGLEVISDNLGCDVYVDMEMNLAVIWDRARRRVFFRDLLKTVNICIPVQFSLALCVRKVFFNLPRGKVIIVGRQDLCFLKADGVILSEPPLRWRVVEAAYEPKLAVVALLSVVAADTISIFLWSAVSELLMYTVNRQYPGEIFMISDQLNITAYLHSIPGTTKLLFRVSERSIGLYDVGTGTNWVQPITRPVDDWDLFDFSPHNFVVGTQRHNHFCVYSTDTGLYETSVRFDTDSIWTARFIQPGRQLVLILGRSLVVYDVATWTPQQHYLPSIQVVIWDYWHVQQDASSVFIALGTSTEREGVCWQPTGQFNGRLVESSHPLLSAQGHLDIVNVVNWQCAVVEGEDPERTMLWRCPYGAGMLTLIMCSRRQQRIWLPDEIYHLIFSEFCLDWIQ